eukprot:jgi/Undpi1/31/HiC_scaffold_1.g00031.m1
MWYAVVSAAALAATIYVATRFPVEKHIEQIIFELLQDYFAVTVLMEDESALEIYSQAPSNCIMAEFPIGLVTHVIQEVVHDVLGVRRARKGNRKDMFADGREGVAVVTGGAEEPFVIEAHHSSSDMTTELVRKTCTDKDFILPVYVSGASRTHPLLPGRIHGIMRALCSKAKRLVPKTANTARASTATASVERQVVLWRHQRSPPGSSCGDRTAVPPCSILRPPITSGFLYAGIGPGIEAGTPHGYARGNEPKISLLQLAKTLTQGRKRNDCCTALLLEENLVPRKSNEQVELPPACLEEGAFCKAFNVYAPAPAPTPPDDIERDTATIVVTPDFPAPVTDTERESDIQVNNHDDSEISGYDDNDEVSQKTTLTTDEVDDGISRSNEDERSLPELINTSPSGSQTQQLKGYVRPRSSGVNNVVVEPQGLLQMHGWQGYIRPHFSDANELIVEPESALQTHMSKGYAQLRVSGVNEVMHDAEDEATDDTQCVHPPTAKKVLYEYKTETGDGTSAVVPVSSVKPTTSLFVFKSTVPTHYGDPERRLISAMVRQRVEVTSLLQLAKTLTQGRKRNDCCTALLLEENLIPRKSNEQVELPPACLEEGAFCEAFIVYASAPAPTPSDDIERDTATIVVTPDFPAPVTDTERESDIQVNHHDDSEISGYNDNDEVYQKTTLTTDEVDDGDSRSNEDERSLPELINTPPSGSQTQRLKGYVHPRFSGVNNIVVEPQGLFQIHGWQGYMCPRFSDVNELIVEPESALQTCTSKGYVRPRLSGVNEVMDDAEDEATDDTQRVHPPTAKKVLHEYKTETGDGTSAVVPVSSVKPTTSLFVSKSTVYTHYGDPERRLISAMVRQRVETSLLQLTKTLTQGRKRNDCCTALLLEENLVPRKSNEQVELPPACLEEGAFCEAFIVYAPAPAPTPSDDIERDTATIVVTPNFPAPVTDTERESNIQVNHHDDSEISGYDDNDEFSQKTTLTTDEVDDGDSRSNEDERSLPELINTPPSGSQTQQLKGYVRPRFSGVNNIVVEPQGQYQIHGWQGYMCPRFSDVNELIVEPESALQTCTSKGYIRPRLSGVNQVMDDAEDEATDDTQRVHPPTAKKVLHEYETKTGDGTSAVVRVSSVKPTTSLFVFKSTVYTHYGDPERRLISAMVRQRVEVIRARC